MDINEENYQEEEIKPIKNMSFGIFKSIIVNEPLLEFKTEDDIFDEDDWNHYYTAFREIASRWRDEYRESLTGKEALINWLYEYFVGWSFNTHSARPVRLVDGWYDAKITDPDHYVGVMGFIPDEDDHVTAVMLEADGVWVKLDNYDILPEKTSVTYWRPVPSTENLR